MARPERTCVTGLSSTSSTSILGTGPRSASAGRRADPRSGISARRCERSVRLRVPPPQATPPQTTMMCFAAPPLTRISPTPACEKLPRLLVLLGWLLAVLGLGRLLRIAGHRLGALLAGRRGLLVGLVGPVLRGFAHGELLGCGPDGATQPACRPHSCLQARFSQPAPNGTRSSVATSALATSGTRRRPRRPDRGVGNRRARCTGRGHGRRRPARDHARRWWPSRRAPGRCRDGLQWFVRLLLDEITSTQSALK